MILDQNEAEGFDSLVDAGWCHKNSGEMAGIEVSAVDNTNNTLPTEFYSAFEAEKMKGVDWDMRPHVLDKKSNKYLLVDSGAGCSAFLQTLAMFQTRSSPSKL